MLPFSVLRIWGLGLFGWALLGLGIYLGYEAYRQFDRPDPSPRPVVERSIDPLPGEQPRTDVRPASPPPPREANWNIADEWQRWALLAGAIACLGLSCGGYWPISFLFGNATGAEAHPLEPSSTLTVDRPDGSRLHVEVYGRPDGPTLLLTHGWSLDLSAWDYVKRDLAEQYRVVAWDLAGLGESIGPSNNDFSLEKMARDLEAVRLAAAPGPAILIGHSIGGMIQQTYCRLHPEQLGENVAGLVLVHTTYTNPLRTNLASGLMTAMETPLIVPLNYLTIALAPLAWLSNWNSYLNGSLQLASRFTSFSGKQTRRQMDHGARLLASAWPATVARGNLAMLAFSEEPTLPQIPIPVLVLSGEHDRLTLPSASEHLERQLPNDRPFSIDAGHLGHWELADRFVDIVTQFAEATFEDGRSRNRRTVAARVPRPAD